MNRGRTNLVVEGSGWAGAAFLVAAYLLIATGYFREPTPLYHVMNLLGAFGVAINASYHRSWPPVVVNTFWACVAIGAIAWSLLKGG